MRSRDLGAHALASLLLSGGMTPARTAGDEFYQTKPSDDHAALPCCGGSREIERRRKRLDRQQEKSDG